MDENNRTKQSHGRMMGLDVGSVRIGVALTDELRMTATPHSTITRRRAEEDLEKIRALAEEWQVSVIVVGVPYQLDGTVGEQTERILRFIENLGRVVKDALIIPWDERLTTAEAERILLEADVSRKRRRLVRDKLAATIILNSYLEATPPDERTG